MYEGNGYITIPVTRLSGNSGAVSVTVATSGGTAVSGTDYTPVSATLGWASGNSTTEYITIPLFHDAAAGTTNRTFDVTLSAATGGATIGSPGSAVVTIDETSGVTAGSPPPVELIDESPNGTQAGDIGALFPSISDDGRFEVFQSTSDNLVPGFPAVLPSDNIFLRDRQTGTTSIVSVDPTGKNVGNGNSTFPIISGNGQYVVFFSAATNLVADDNPGNNNYPYVEVLVRNLQTGVTVLASKDSNGNPIQANCESISISDNGSEVAFDDMNNVYLYNVQTDTTTVLTHSGNAPSNNPVLSADGNFVAFDSLANNLDPSDTDIAPYDNYQVYEGNVQTGAIKLVSTDVAGTGAGTDGTSVFPSLSANGRYVAFQSDSQKLVSTPVQGGSVQDVYLRDMTKSSPTLVSLDTAGTAGGDSSSFQPEISANAAYVAFFSLANNLTTNDSGNEMIASEEVFERNLNTNTTILVSTNAAGTGIPNNTSKLGNEYQSYENPAQQAAGAISGDGQYVLFESLASNVVPNEVRQNSGGVYGTDIYVRNTVTNTTTLITHELGTTATTGDNISGGSIMTPSGQYVAFQSEADDLVTNDTSAPQTNVYASPTLVSAPPPAATTVAATSITSTGATLNASVNPEGSATTYQFVYGTSSNLSSGTTKTTSQSAGSGTSAESESAPLTGLTASTTYYFEVQATSAGGTTDGSILHFTTSAAAGTPPAATTVAASSITSTGATLNATVNPEGSATTYSFIYGTSSTLSSGTTTTAQSAGSGTSAESETAALSGLTSGTTYYFEVRASNSGGTTDGSILHFTTSAAATPPAATTVAATAITATGATLNATVNPEGSATTYSFIYGTSSTLSSGTTTTAQSAGSGTSAESETAALSGLTPGTTYYFEVRASNSGGTTDGSILHFTTSAAAGTPPAATTVAASSITSTGATLNATVNPEGSATTYSFIYGTSSTLSSGTTTTAQSAGSGTSAESETAALSGLTSGTTYYFEVRASNSGGTTDGSILHFTTSAAATPPAATTVAATAITATGATLNATVNPEGSATTYSFIYGTSSTLSSGTTTTAQSAGSGTSAESETAALSGLTPGTTYYFEVRASNAGGTTDGTILHFTTSAAVTPAVLQFSSSQFNAAVTDGSGEVAVTRTGNLSAALSVVLSSPGGHEVAPFSETVNFGPDVSGVAVSVPIANDGQPGEATTVIPFTLSSPSAGATLGATASASLVIVDNNPPFVTITGLQPSTIKVGTGRKAKKQSVYELQFSGPVNGAGSLGLYVLDLGKTKKHKTTYTTRVPLTSAAYNYPGTPPNSVTLFLKSKPKGSAVQLTVNAGAITDSYGRPLGNGSVTIQ